MGYCTTTDVYLEAGTATGTATVTDIGNMITRSDAEIVGMLRIKNLTAPSVATEDLKTASIQLTVAKIKRRQSQELSRPGSLSLGGDISFSAQPETEAAACEAKAKLAIEAYIASVNGAGPRVSRIRSRCR
jgi:hypothetical protein